MKRLALTALVLASIALSGAALADDYDNNQGSYRSGYQYGGSYGDGYDNSNGVRFDNARVLSVDPVIDQYYSQSRRECWTVPAGRNSRYGNRSYNQNYAGNYGYGENYRGRSNNTNAVLGGVIGAALGNQVGSGDGKRAATVAGAMLGYAIARDSQNARREGYRYDDAYSGGSYDSRNDLYGNGYYTEPNGQLRCRMVNDGQYAYGYQNNRYDSSRDYRYGRDSYVNERYQDRYNHDRYDNRYDEARVTGYRVTFEYHGQTYTTVTDYHPGSNIRVRVNVEADGDSEVGYGDRDFRDDRYARY